MKEEPRMNGYKTKCNYCHGIEPDAVVEHRELRCTEHLSRYMSYALVPQHPTGMRCLTQFAMMRGVLSSVPTNELGMP